jgi:excisionase family DNA binding protein
MPSSSLSRVVRSTTASRRVSNGRKAHHPGAKNLSVSQPIARGELPTALYRIDEAAEFLNVKPKTLRNRISLGQIAIYRIGRGVRISKETLQDMLDRGYVPAAVANASRRGRAREVQP